MAGTNLGDIVAHLKLEMGEFTNSLNVAKNQIQETGSKFDGLTAAGQSVTSVGKALTVGVTAPVMALGASIVKTQSQFQDSMAKVQALSGATGEEFEKLKQTAMEFGESTVFSASECADALGYMALAGWDAEESTAALPGILNLAAASQMDLAQASDLCTDYMSAFGMEAGDAAHFADVLAYAQANSNTTTEMLGEAFKNCAVNAKGFGLDVEQTTALLGKLADQGLKGSEAGTALNAVFRDMSSKMEDGAIKIGNMSVKVTDAQGNFRDMTDIIRDVNAATNGLSESEKMVALQSTFTADSIKAMGILCNTGADDIDSMTQALYGADGTAEEMSDTMNNTLSGAIKELSSAWEGLQLKLMDSTGVLTKLIKALTSVVRWISNLPDGVKQVIIVFAGLLATIGPVLLIIGKLMTSVQGLIKTFSMLKAAITALKSFSLIGSLVSGFNTVITWLYVFIMDSLIPAFGALWAFMLANPITFVIAAIVALVAIFVVLWKKCDWFREFWIDLWNKCKEAVVGFYNRNKEVFDAVVAFFTRAWEAIKTVFGGFITFLKGVFTGDMDTAVAGLKQIWEGYTAWWHNIWDGLGNVVSLAWEGIKTLFSSFGEWLWNFFTVTVPEAFSQFITWLAELPGKIAYWLAYCIMSVVKWKMDMTQKAIECAKQFVSNVIQWLKELPGKVWTWLVNTYNKAVQWGSNMKQKAQEAGTNFVNGAVNFIKNLPSRIWTFLSNTISKASQFASNFAAKARQAGTQFFNNIVNTVRQIPSQMLSIGSQICQGLANGIRNGISSVVNAARNLVSNAVQGAKDALGIHSPSRVFKNEVGKQIVQGIIVGIKADASEAYSTIKDLSQRLIESVNLPNLTNSMNIVTDSVSTNNIVDNRNVDRQIQQLSNSMAEELKKVLSIDYDKMANAFKSGAEQVNNPIYMDHTLVGKKTASAVSKTNEVARRRLNRLEGVFDDK